MQPAQRIIGRIARSASSVGIPDTARELKRSSMHLVLTDVLTCPRCGPAQGLIVFSQRMEERRILEGALGCPNCETQYPIRNGLADLLAAGQEAGSWEGPVSSELPDAFALAALLGITEGPGFALLLGASADVAAEIARGVPKLELVVAGAGATEANEQSGVNRLRCSAAVPLRDGSMRGVVLLQDVAAATMREVVRLLGPGARLIARGAHEKGELERAGLRVLAHDANTVVAERVV